MVKQLMMNPAKKQSSFPVPTPNCPTKRLLQASWRVLLQPRIGARCGLVEKQREHGCWNKRVWAPPFYVVLKGNPTFKKLR